MINRIITTPGRARYEATPAYLALPTSTPLPRERFLFPRHFLDILLYFLYLPNGRVILCSPILGGLIITAR